MSGWDDGGVYTFDTDLYGQGPESGNVQTQELSKAAQQQRFRKFIKEFRHNNSYIYRDALMNNYRSSKYALEVQMTHLNSYDEALENNDFPLNSVLKARPAEFIPLFEAAATELLVELLEQPGQTSSIPQIQILLIAKAETDSMRGLRASEISKLVVVSGIIIGTSRTRAKATDVTIRCRNCNNTKKIPCRPGYGGARMPRTCDRQRTSEVETPCPIDPYYIVGEKSSYIDQQSLKVQERPESVPVGEMPRSILVSVDRTLVNLVIPGMRVTITGIYSIFNSDAGRKAGPAAVATRSSYIRAVGLVIDEHGAGRTKMNFTGEEEEKMRELARDPNIVKRITGNIAPNIKGHDQIKKAIACLMFGGSRKRLPDGMRLRGDINVLLLGDPSTAKSQLLKFVHKVAPVGVYTSGKGSSAAGLTASVVRDPSSSEFFLEGGAMVLADDGVVCIDEFDKMRAQDRVAIHEAMEQQTISIAKAGITTILNSRAAVLAAANPKFGSFTDMKEAEEQVDFETTILSRFDLIFFVRDVRDAARDKEIAGHVLKVHMSLSDSARGADADGDMQATELKRYIAFCRERCAPVLEAEAAEQLQTEYVSLRQTLSQNNQSAIPITVRQLESLVRIAEALAKMELSPRVTPKHAKEAIELFNQSTKDAAMKGLNQPMSSEDSKEVEEIERQIKRRLAAPQQALSVVELRKMFERQRFQLGTVHRVMQVLVQRSEFEFVHGRKMFRRIQ